MYFPPFDGCKDNRKNVCERTFLSRKSTLDNNLQRSECGTRQRTFGVQVYDSSNGCSNRLQSRKYFTANVLRHVWQTIGEEIKSCAFDLWQIRCNSNHRIGFRLTRSSPDSSIANKAPTNSSADITLTACLKHEYAACVKESAFLSRLGIVAISIN
jgi:hypothetical protein